MSKEEIELRNFLKEHDVYGDDSDMQEIILNSFYNQLGMNNDDSWKKKIKFISGNSGSFKKYALQYWSNTQQPSKILYALFDEMYHTNPALSRLLEVCTTLDEAKKKFPSYGKINVPVKCLLEKNEDDEYSTVSSTVIVLEG